VRTPTLVTPSVALRPEDASASLYEAHFGFVWRTLGYLGLSGASQEDAAQDVFVVAHRRLGAFEERAAVQTWLYAIARNVTRNYKRGSRRRGPQGELPDDWPSNGPTPEEDYQRKQALTFVQSFLESLDEPKREVFLLCELEQLPAVEVGELLRVSPNTVSSRLRLARVAFARAVEEHRRIHVP